MFHQFSSFSSIFHFSCFLIFLKKKFHFFHSRFFMLSHVSLFVFIFLSFFNCFPLFHFLFFFYLGESTIQPQSGVEAPHLFKQSLSRLYYCCCCVLLCVVVLCCDAEEESEKWRENAQSLQIASKLLPRTSGPRHLSLKNDGQDHNLVRRRGRSTACQAPGGEGRGGFLPELGRVLLLVPTSWSCPCSEPLRCGAFSRTGPWRSLLPQLPLNRSPEGLPETPIVNSHTSSLEAPSVAFRATIFQNDTFPLEILCGLQRCGGVDWKP